MRMAYLPLLAALFVLMCVPSGVAQNRFVNKGHTSFPFPQTDQGNVPFSSQLSPTGFSQTSFSWTQNPYPHLDHIDTPLVTQTIPRHMPFPIQPMPPQNHFRQTPFPGPPMPSQDHFRQTPFPGPPMPSQDHFRQTPFPGQPMPSQDHFRQAPFPGQPMPSQDHFRQTPFPGQPMPSQDHFRQQPFPGHNTGVSNDDSHMLFHDHPPPPKKSFFDEFVGVVEILLGLFGSAYNFTSGDPIQQILGTVDFYEEIKDL